MITWLMVGLLLFTESACDRGKNAISNGSDTSTGGGSQQQQQQRSYDNGTTASYSNNSKILNSIVIGDKKGGKTTTDDEDVYSLTCYTCVNVSDNKMCNEWAIDTPCPASGRDFCRSLHILDSRGKSVLVSKSCVNKIECSPASVGCVPIDTQKICISCCDTSYCNIESPTNATNATFSRKRPKKKPKKKTKASHAGEDEVSNVVVDDNVDGDEDVGDEDGERSNRSTRLFSGLTTCAFAAISVFLNRAYH